MYIPSFNRQQRRDAVKFMQTYPFGTLVNILHGKPVATHLPFVINLQQEEIVIRSHLARANEQWKALEESRSLIIFQEPHAYISPKYYDKKLNVPTWNYVAVHAYGSVRIIDDRPTIHQLITQTIRNFEEEYFDQWQSLPDKYREGMINGIVAFEVKIDDLQGKEKLSQNKKDNEIRKIISGLKEAINPMDRAMGNIMDEKLGGTFKD